MPFTLLQEARAFVLQLPSADLQARQVEMQVACYSLQTDAMYVNDMNMNFVNANMIYLGREPGPYAQRKMHSPLSVGTCLYILV